MTWTVFEYLYRDADNHKVFGNAAFEGIAPDLEWETALRNFVEGSYFIAEQIGLPALCDQLYRWSENAPTEADHCWHEFVSLDVFSEADPSASIQRYGQVAEFVARVSAVEAWDIWRSPNLSM